MKNRSVLQTLAVLVIGSVLPLVAMGTFVIWSYYQREQTQETEAAISRARAVTSAVDREVGSTQAALGALATSPLLAKDELAGFHAQAKVALASLNAENIVLLDRTGQLLLTTARPWGTPLPKVPNPVLLQRILKTGQPGLSDLFFGPVAGKLIYTIAVPVKRDGAIVYSLNATVAPTQMLSVLLEQKLPESWRGVIADSSGSVVARTHEMDRYLGGKVAPELLKRMSVSNEDGLETRTLEGIPVLTVFSRSAVTGWTVALGAPLDEVNAGIRRTLAQMLAATLVALGLGLALAWVSGGRIVSAVTRDRESTERANRKFHQVVEATPTAIVMVDQAGAIVMVNTQTEKSFGYSRGELLGQSVEILLPEPFRNRHPHHRGAFYSDPSPRAMGAGRNLLGRHKDGSEFPVEVGLNPIDTDDGPMVLSTITDISERNRASERLRTLSAYARTLLESSLDPLVTINAQGKITDVNEASVQATGVAREQLIGTDFSDYFTDPDKARAGYEKVFSEGLVRDYPLAIRHTTGRIIDVLYNAAVFKDDKGNVIGVFAAARDVTARNLLDRALQETNAELVRATFVAEEANRAKSDFLSSMSHELRTPLNAILGFAQLLESGTPPPTPLQKPSLDHILNGGWHLLELVNEILDLTLIESGKVTLSLEPVSLSEVMSECRAMVEPQARMRGIKLPLSGCETSCFVSADRTRLKQALINLLSNAIKYNRPEGEVAIECRLSPMDSIRITVRDTGEGLTAEKLAQLFQPFNRIGREAGLEEGTGIGLVVTKRLVELMGGTIGAESTVGVGSLFWIELGLTTAPALTVEETGHGVPLRQLAVDSTPRRTVLYVEDNPASLELVEQLVARHSDLKILTAADGNLGIEFARVYQPDVILMDINLPGISGFDALKILRADPTTAHIPIIAVSANALPGEINTAIEAGFFSYLTKPIKINQFMDELSAALAVVTT